MGGRANPLVLSAASSAWGVVVMSAAFWFPAVRTTTVSCSPGERGPCTHVSESSGTLVAAEGLQILYWLSIPLVASVIVGVLVFASLHGYELARWLAWVAFAGFALVSFVGGASVGLWFYPSVVLLTFAVSGLAPVHHARASQVTP
jgi:hypothetical protein